MERRPVPGLEVDLSIPPIRVPHLVDGQQLLVGAPIPRH